MSITQEQLDKVFHAYDIRGLTPEQLNEEFFESLGKAFVKFLNAKEIVLGHDIRPDSKRFHGAFVRGATSMGCNVTNIGQIATEMVYFATGKFERFDGGAVITASHNPTGWNGCKMVGKKSKPISKDSGLSDIKSMMLESRFEQTDQVGEVTDYDIYPEFKEAILDFLGDTEIKDLNVIVDAGNGIGGVVFDYVFGDLPLNVEKMYFEPDGNFPNHVPDPLKEENVKEIKQKTVEMKADIGIAIDGDADRVFFIDNKGRNPSGVYTGAVFAKAFLKETPGATIIHDPRVTWPMQKEIEKNGGKAIVNKAGHSFFKEAMSRENAVFAAEQSSHFFYKDFFNADAGMVTIAIMLKMLSEGLDFDEEMDHFYANYPNSGEVNFVVDDIQSTIKKVEDTFADSEPVRVDGISFEFEEWRFNLRASNTQPLLRLNVEAKNKEILIKKYKMIEELIGGTRDNEPAMKELV